MLKMRENQYYNDNNITRIWHKVKIQKKKENNNKKFKKFIVL